MTGLHQIIADYGPALGRIAASYEADRALQEDLVQEMLIAIHRALPSLQQPDRLAPFIFRIAHNRAATHVMRQAGANRRPPAELGLEEPGPEERLLSDERSRRVAAAIRRLPLPYRQVMTLLLEEMSYAEIAETLEISLSNVGVRVNRAKAQLRTMLDDD